jgi:predicted molibdopterin-dependent oxidoreductase YjgC
MCVLGRFCIPSLVNAPDRIKMPYIKKDDDYIPSSWEDAIGEVSEVLAKTDVEKIGFLGGPHMTSEAAYLFAKLARVGVKTANVDFLGSDFAAFIHNELATDEDFDRIRALDYLKDVDWIVSLGGDFVKTHQVAAKRVYTEISKGTPLIILDEVGLNLRRWTTEIVSVTPKKLAPLLSALAERKGSLPKVKAEQAKRILEITSQGKGAILIGQRILEVSEPDQILRTLVTLAGDNGVLFPLFPLGNEAGAIKAGLRPEMLPGPASVTVKEARNATEKNWGKSNLEDGLSLAEMRDKAKKKQLDVLYVTDGSIPVEGFEKVPTIIYQSPYPSRWMELAAVVLPSSTFTEENGTFVNLEMKPFKLKQIVKPPGTAKEDWLIFMDIGKRLGADGFDYKNTNEIWQELQQFARSIEVGGQSRRSTWKSASQEQSQWYPRYRGAVLPERIQDLATFVKALSDRERPDLEDTLEELFKRVEHERISKAKEVSK